MAHFGVRGEELASTSSRLDTRENQEISLMVIKASTTHLVGEGQSIVRSLLFVNDNYAH